MATINGTSVGDVINGGEADDTIHGNGGNDVIYGDSVDQNNYNLIDNANFTASSFGAPSAAGWVNSGPGTINVATGPGADYASIISNGGTTSLTNTADGTFTGDIFNASVDVRSANVLGGSATARLEILVNGVVVSTEEHTFTASGQTQTLSTTIDPAAFPALAGGTIEFRVSTVGSDADQLVFTSAFLSQDNDVPLQGNDTLDGGAGDDTIYGGGGDDTIVGGTGNDIIDGGSGADTIDAGDGDDLIRNLAQGPIGTGNLDNQADIINAGAGNDTIEASFGNDTMDGGAGIDHIDASAISFQQVVDLEAGTGSFTGTATTAQVILNVENYTSGNGADIITGSSADNVLTTNGGHDTVDGGAGNDTINAGSGNDIIDGGSGADTLTGGVGNDTFIVSSGADVITDFNSGNTGAIDDGNQSNNDFVDLSAYYNSTTLAVWNANNPGNQFSNPLGWLRADLAEDGVLNAAEAGWTAGNSLTLQTGGAPVPATSLTFDNTNVVCFAGDTVITTIQGDVPISRLSVGDNVLTLDNGYQPIRWIGCRTLSMATLISHPNLMPIRICANALGEGLPSKDLLVSPQHRVLVNSKISKRMFGQYEVLVAAKQLLEIDGIDVAEDVTLVDYWHILFDQHEIVFSNGALAESLFTGPEAIKNLQPAARDEIFEIFPELREATYESTPCRQLVSGKMGRKLAARCARNSKFLFDGGHQAVGAVADQFMTH